MSKLVIKKSQILKVCDKLKLDFKNYSFLSSGSHNASYVINTKQSKLVLRVENNPQFKNLKKEYRFLKMLGEKIAPKALLFDNSKKIIHRDYVVYEFVKGKHPPRKPEEDFVKTMALWYKKLHSIRIKHSGKYHSLHKRFAHYLKGYNVHKKGLEKELPKNLSLLFKRSSQVFKKYDNLHKGTKYLVLNHGDPTRTNVLYKKGEVKLIDWEFVRYALKEGDLVFFFYSYDLNERQRKMFLKTYGYPTSKISIKRFNSIFLLHYLSLIVWAMERIDLLNKRKLDLGQAGTNKKELLQMIKADIKEANNLMDKYFL